MRIRACYFVFSLFASFALTQAFAHSYGPAPRVTAAPGDNARACTQCHATGALNSFSGSVKISLQSGPVYIPGIKQRVMVRVADPDQQRWGFELTARMDKDPSNGQAGELIPVDNFTQVICEDAGPKPCASGVSFIQHTSAGTRIGTKNGATFQFDWVPPATDVGPVTLYVAGNAANGDGTPGGDHIYTSNVQLMPAIPVAPTVTAGGVVSSATLAAGPVSANSWVTVYGSDLSATTRGWNDSDFANGALPFSLDGVSVLLTGAPRLAYVGYVSPTQVNFLIPSDANPATYQVQIRNSAGISKQAPIVVQANAGQMLTLDGKHVAGARADGSLLDKAAPGDMITIYATGCGPTSPGLIPGQIPIQANSLATLPQITIGDSPANVASGTVVPGSAGVYQFNVQVPASAPNGDLPVVITFGTASSAPTLITIQK